MESYHHIFNAILEQASNISCPSIEVEGKTYKTDVLNQLIVLALNIVLVLKGARLAYKDMDILYNNKFMVDIIKKLCDDEIVIMESVEPVVFLRKNTLIIKDILAKTKHVLGIGKILGYAYIGDDWYQSHSRYMIHYQAKDVGSHEFPLYGFMCPVLKYNEIITAKILKDRELFESVLKKYGYSVNVKIYALHGSNTLQEGCEEYLLSSEY